MNLDFEICRQTALKLLHPTEKELQHGLELHHDAFVFDAYGFSPIGGGAAPQIDEKIAAGAGRDEYNSALEEFIKSNVFKNNDKERQRRKAAWDLADVNCTFQNSGVEGNDIENLIKRLSYFTYIADSSPELYERAVFPHQLPEIRKRGHRAIFMTTNGVPLPLKLNSEEEAVEYISVFFNLGVRMMHMTYNRRNLIGDGCAEKANGGLSGLGRRVVTEMNRVGVIPDVAHSGQKTSYECACCSKKPVVASHTVSGALSTHYRGKSDEVIEAIKKSGGFVGVCTIPHFLQRSGDICAMLDHIEYIAKKFGADHVAIGTDTTARLDWPVLKNKMPKTRPIFNCYWPDEPAFTTTEEQIDSVTWTNWPLFTVGLVQRGFSDVEIRKIIGGNVLRVIEETLA